MNLLVVANRWGTRDVDVYWMRGTSANDCITRADKRADLSVMQAGTYWLAVDSYVSGGRALAGAYRLTVVAVP